MSCSRRIRARSLSLVAASRARAISASCAAFSCSISWVRAIRASSSSRAICSFSFSASITDRRTDTSASASIAARSFFEVAITSASLRMPTALKALFSSRSEKGVWSSAVSDTDSSSNPFFSRSFDTAFCTSCTKLVRFSCSSSIVIRAATARRPSISLPSIISRRPSTLNVLSPSVWAARLIPSSVAWTET